jgi:predicted transcriptional regulator
MMLEYVNSITVPEKFEDLPDLDDQTWDDLTDIAHLATTARSPVTRSKYGPNKEVLDKGFKESLTRMFDQLCVAAYGLIMQNPDRKITQRDRKIIYKLGMDCIDPKKKAVLVALTKFSLGGGPEEIATEIGFTKGSAEQFTEDLMIHGMVTRERVPYYGGHKTIFKIVPLYKDIMSRFENIEIMDKAMPGSDEKVPLPEEPIGVSMEDNAALATLFNK